MRAVLVLAAVLAVCAASPAQAQRPHRGGPSILHARGDAVRVRLLDAASARPLADVKVEIWSDNGIRCIRAPCPTNGMRWQGRSDPAGFVVVPTRVLQASTTISVSGYDGGNLDESQQGPDGSWKMRLRRTSGS